MRSILTNIPFFIFLTLSNLQWVQFGNNINGEFEGDRFGYSVSMSSDGKVIAIGAILSDGNGDDSGQVRVFKWINNQWVQLGDDINGESEGDRSGYSVSLSNDGKIIAIGAVLNDGNGIDSGHVRIYKWNGNQWIQLGDDINGEAAYDGFGHSLDISSDGNTIIIGAPGNGDNGQYSGHVRIYKWNGNQWIQLGDDINGRAVNDLLGGSVSMSADGNIIAIGAVFNDDNGTNSGHVRTFEWNGFEWIQFGDDIKGEVPFQLLGGSVSLSANGNIMAIGATGYKLNGENSGIVQVFNWDGNVWSQVGNGIYGEAMNDLFGYKVSLSSNGKILCISSPFNDNNKVNSGVVQVYRWEEIDWIQLGNRILGESTNDQFGRSIGLSDDGSKLVIGTDLKNGNGEISGQVRTYFIHDNILNVAKNIPTLNQWSVIILGIMLCIISFRYLKSSKLLIKN